MYTLHSIWVVFYPREKSHFIREITKMASFFARDCKIYNLIKRNNSDYGNATFCVTLFRAYTALYAGIHNSWFGLVFVGPGF